MDYKNDLMNNILPFWQKRAVDYKNGGIFTCLDRRGEIYGTDKSVWFQGRALWVFSKAYNCICKNEEYLKIAKNIYSFLPKCTDVDGRMFFTVTAGGRGIQKRRYYFSETFAAIGCAELFKATGDDNVKKSAEAFFDTAYRCFTGEIKCEPKFNESVCSSKSLSPVMIMLSTAQVMRSMNTEKCDFYDKICSECLSEILYGGFLKENTLLENIAKDGTFIDSPNGRKVNPGHSMEAAWFVLAEGLLKKNQTVIEAGLHIADITLPIGLDRTYGGVIAFADVSSKPPCDLEWDMKLWWPQCETLIAARLAYNVSGNEKYKKLYENIKAYCEKYFVDKEWGEWYGYLHYDNTPSTDLKGNIFKGPFHIPRLYMIMAIMDETGGIERFME